MNIFHTPFPDIKLFRPKIFNDHRGYFFEGMNLQQFQQATNSSINFVQDNRSLSQYHVLRGLHCQREQPQGKLITVLNGIIFDVVVDLRPQSPYYGQWISHTLSAQSKLELWIPAGFAHGFLTLSATAEVFYKTTEYWNPALEVTIAWNDPHLAINWPINTQPILSEKDSQGIAWNIPKILHWNL